MKSLAGPARRPSLAKSPKHQLTRKAGTLDFPISESSRIPPRLSVSLPRSTGAAIHVTDVVAVADESETTSSHQLSTGASAAESPSRSSSNPTEMIPTPSPTRNDRRSFGSFRRASSSTFQGPEEVALDPVAVGDLLSLQTALPGILVGDAAFGRAGMLVRSDKLRPPLNMGDCVFRVCPMLNYRQRQELELALALSNSTKAQAAKKTKNVDSEYRMLSLLRNRVTAEEKRNAEMLDTVVEGSFNNGVPSVVKYGDVVQLQHVSTGAFLSAMESAAPFDPECRAVELNQDGSSSALFKFMPRYKAQAVGSIVYYTHSVVLESVKLRGMLLHTSAVAYSDTPVPTDTTLPKCLQTEKTLETNLSPQFETFEVVKFARFGPKEASLFKTSMPFRMYHSQSEAFVHASCDSEKDRVHPESRKGFGVDVVFPAHIPFLKELDQEGGSPDPTDPSHHSPKGVWCFEPLQRSSACTLSWETPFRLRHVPSGRYLCVDVTAGFKPTGVNVSQDEKWYSTYLVDDEAGTRTAEGIKVVPHDWMSFTVSSADSQTSESIPDADVSLRVEHSSSGQRLYLHSSEVRKPDFINKAQKTAFARTIGLVFSTVRSSQDIFKLLRVNQHEAAAIRTAKSMLVPTALYSIGAGDPRFHLTTGVLVHETISVLLKVIGMLIQGGLQGLPPAGEAWIPLANGTLPAAFSAMFGGARESFIQRIFRDTKLFDSVFNMGKAMYQRGNETTTDRDLLRAVQKLIHVALQRLLEGESASQSYFGRRQSPSDGTPWMETILQQLEDPLGSAVTLSKLLGANEQLMDQFADAKLVLRFAEMIRNLGPQPRLVNFFEAICTMSGRPIKTNQEMVLRLTWMNEEWRRKVYLMTAAFPGQSKNFPSYGEVLDPSGKVSPKHDGTAASAGAPADYIGKAVFESVEGLPPVFVQWSSSDSWKQGVDDLFWAPSKLGLGIPTYDLPAVDGRKGKSKWVRLEDLCWIQDPHRLCHAVTGQSYSKVLKDSETDLALSVALKAQSQLVDYYVGQLLLFSKMCFGRSYNVIDWLTRQFSYEILASICYNPHLPPRVRGASCSLVQNLYLDRFPQMHNCGRPTLPEVLWTYDSESTETETVINALTLKDSGSLPEFGLSANHPLRGNPDPFLGFSSGFKFYILRNFGNKFLAGFGDGTLVLTQQHENMMARTVMGLIDTLASFGFQSSLPKIKDLLKYLIPILDGRMDAASIDKSRRYVPFSPPSKRYALSNMSLHVTVLKTNVIKVLISVSNLRANFRLRNLLSKFKEYNQDRRLRKELLEIHKLYVENKTALFGGERGLVLRLFRDFETLFDEGDGLTLQLEKLAGTPKTDAPMNEILIDCLMYEDDDLFRSALELLERTFAQRRQLVDALGAITLLEDEKLPVFENVSNLNSRISHFTFLCRSSEVWGVSSRVSGQFIKTKYTTVLEMCDAICEFIFADSPLDGVQNSRNQDTLRAANLQTALVAALQMNYNISFEGSICSSEDKVKSREWISSSLRKLVVCMKDFVRGNSKNQGVIWPHLSALRKHLGPLKLPKAWPRDFPEKLKASIHTEPRIDTEAVIVECLRGNAALCEFEVPKNLIEQFGSLLNAAPDPSVAIEVEFFTILCQPRGEKPLQRNQTMVLQVLLDERLENLQSVLRSLFLKTNVTQASLSKPERLIDLLTATISGKNLSAATLLSKVCSLDSTLDALDRMMQSLQLPASDVPDRKTEEKFFAQELTFGSLLALLAQQLDVLVVDPKVFRTPRSWKLVSVGVNRILSSVATLVMSGSVDELTVKAGLDAAAAADIAFFVISGARSLGLEKQEVEYQAELVAEQDSVLNSAATIRASSEIWQTHKRLANASGRLEIILNPTGALPAVAVNKNASSSEDLDLDEDESEWASSLGDKRLLRQRTTSFAGFAPVFGANFDQSSHDESRGDSDDPVAMQRYFWEALTSNPLLNNKIASRRFALVECLEEAGKRTGPEAAGVVPGADGRGSVKIEWLNLAARMVKYVRKHNFDRDHSGCLRVFRVLQAYLLKSRSELDGVERDPIDLDDAARTLYHSKQDELVDCGVVEVVLTAIATHSSNGPEGLFAEGAIDLLLEMLNGTGSKAQVVVSESINSDPDSKFLLHLRSRMMNHLSAIEERKQSTAASFQNMTSEQRAGLKSCAKTFILLKYLCEGHNRKAQDVLREQHGKSWSINLVGLAAQMLTHQLEEYSMLTKMEDMEVELLCNNMDFLVESMQGPCPGNQEFVVGVEGFTASLEKVIQSDFHSRVSPTLVLYAKEAATHVIVACMEGRSDRFVHRKLAEGLDPEILDMLKSHLGYVLGESEKSLASAADFEVIERLVMASMASLVTIISQLVAVSKEFEDKQEAVLRSSRKEGDAGDDLMAEEIVVVEISWIENRIEQVAFPVLPACRYLTEATKEEFFLKCDLSTSEKRMKQLLANTPMFDAEMRQVYELCSDTPMGRTYRFIHEHLNTIKWAMYGTIVMLNLNVLMAAYGTDSPNGYSSLLEAPNKSRYYLSMTISLALALINLAGYVVVMSFSTITEVPIIIRRLDEYVAECKRTVAMKEESYRNLHAFDLWLVTLGANVLFIIMHRVNEDANGGLYLFLILGINMPWTLRCMRNYIVVPNTPQTRFFSVCYDVIVTKPFFRNNVILMACSILGFANTRFFAFMLLDVLNMSPTLANIIRSVTDNLLPLLLVLYLIICAVIIYAHFGLESFQEQFTYGDDEGRGCRSAVGCAFLIFYVGVAEGRLVDVLHPLVKGNPDFINRMLYDLTFFVVIGIILFNIITGLMVDGFGALRDEANQRSEVIDNACFVCGFTREFYDDIPGFYGPSFDEHKDKEHNYWFYVYYYVYLKQKRKTDFSGVETFVWKMIQLMDSSWIPSRNSAALQASESAAILASDEAAESAAASTEIVELKSAVAEMKSEIKALTDSNKALADLVAAAVAVPDEDMW